MEKPGESSSSPATGSASESAALRLRDMWQVPALAVAVALLVSGVVVAMVTSPSPNFTPVLERAERLVEHEQYEEAIELLNDRVHRYLERPELSPAERRQYHLLLARAIYGGQQDLGISLDENHLAALGQFLEAERQGAGLTPQDQAMIADTYIELREYDDAMRRLDMIPESRRVLRDRLHRRLVERWLARTVPDYERAAGLLARMLTDPELTMEDRVWALAQQARVQLAQGYDDEAIIRLLRALPRLDGAPSDGLAELHMLLGRAYRRTNAVEEASRSMERARALAASGDVVFPEVLLETARIEELRQELGEARDRYAEIVDRFIDSNVYASALLGLGQVEAAMRNTDASVEAYTTLVRSMETGLRTTGPDVETVKDSLIGRYIEHAAADEIDHALAFARLAGRLYGHDDRPADVLEALALSHLRTAERLVREVSIGEGRSGAGARKLALERLDPSTQREVQQHMLAAAANFRLHADRFVLVDNDVYARSLWTAADLFDRGGDLAAAVQAFTEYADGMPGDPRQPEARFRLGQAYQALGDHEMAAELYSGLIEEKRSGQASSVGPFADRAYVPLAQVYLLDGDATTDAEARRLLTAVVDGTLGGTGTLQFRDALLELGRLHYRAAEFERAIERFEEAIARYPDDAELESIRFELADSYRLSAHEIEAALREAMPDSRRRELERAMRRRRMEAMAGFEQVRRALESLDARRRSALQEVQLRNAYFYLGDCAFDLGDFDAAIRHYDTARERYPSDPASLVAMVQIVNAHVEQGDLRRARTANERAIRFYRSLPDDVWNDPNLPMGRRDWERWLSASSKLQEFGSR